MTGEAVIQVGSLEAGYVKSHVLFGVNFEAIDNEITVIVGPNGCGKSTLLKSIFGLTSVYSGSITYKGKAITGLEPYVIARKKIAYLPQIRNVFADLTIMENLTMASYTLDSRTFKERLPGIMETFPELEKRTKAKANSLSGGQRQMLAMAMALIRHPDSLLFDEPTASLSPKLAAEVLDKIKLVRREYGITIVLVEQNIRQALAIGDKVYLLANGKNVYSGGTQELLEHKDLGKMYLGTHDDGSDDDGDEDESGEDEPQKVQWRGAVPAGHGS